MALRLMLLVGAIGATILGLTGCGYVSAGPTATEDRTISGDPSAVLLEGSGTLSVQPGDPALTITAGENTLERISSTTRSDELHLAVDGGFLNSPGPIDYALTMAQLDAVTIDGSGEVTASRVPAESLTVRIEGSGDVLITDVDADQVSVVIEGSGAVRLRGHAEEVQVHIDGAGEFHGEDLIARTGVASIDGAGDITIHASQTLEASISGAGSIRHSGGADVTEEIDGAGEVRPS